MILMELSDILVIRRIYLGTYHFHNACFSTDSHLKNNRVLGLFQLLKEHYIRGVYSTQIISHICSRSECLEGGTV